MSVAFDEDVLRRMSDLVVAVNRRRHAEGAASDDPARLRLLAAEEERAERAYVEALTTRGWHSPFALARGA